MKLNPYVTIMISIAIMLTGFLVISGCRKQPAPTEPPRDAVTAKEVSTTAANPFRDTAGRTATLVAGVVADAAREQNPILSAGYLSRLHISGIALLLLAVAARFLLGSWKDAYIATGLGICPSVLAVLLTEYPRVVLLIPCCGVVILGIYVYLRASKWRAKADGFDVVATSIEKADTGAYSLGQLMKNTIAETKQSGVVDKALKPLEKIWKQASPA